MQNKKVLFVSAEMIPYLADNEVSINSYELPKFVHTQGGQIRIFMPRFGNINERRHQLHEVIRLSGMNLVVNKIDTPLIIKVASIPRERIQVYFIENEEYFKRKATFSDEDDVLYPDNDERAIFFAKGVVETVKKLNWLPDIIHIHGWMASLLPLYIRTFYKNEALFKTSKIITSVYSKDFQGTLDNWLFNKIKTDGIKAADCTQLQEPSYNHLIQNAIQHSDGVIIASDDLNLELTKFIESSSKPFLPFAPKEEMMEAHRVFYNKLLEK
jgi:starch synthase